MERKSKIDREAKNKKKLGTRANVHTPIPPKKEEIPKAKPIKQEIMQIGGSSYSEKGYATADIDETKFSEEELKSYFKFNYEFDIKKAKFELDPLQNKMLEFYIRADPRFRRAFYTDYTADFFNFLKEKTRLREPLAISTMGMTRTITDKNFIFTEKGWRHPSDMEDCKEVLSWNFDSEMYEWKPFELIKRKRNPKEKFYKITFSDNRTIEIGEKHPIFTTTKGWKKAFSLYPSIDIPVFKKYPQQKSEEKISVNLARILAFLLSCGHMNNSHCKYMDKRDKRVYNRIAYTISYANSSKEMVKLFIKDFYKEFGKKPRYKKKRYNEYRGIEVEIGCKNIFQEIVKYVPAGKKSHIIEIPRPIFYGSEEIQREFLATLFSGDGYVGTKTRIVEYYSMSEKFVKQIQLILIQYGIISYILHKKTWKGTIIFRLGITNGDNIKAFYRFIKKLPNPKKSKRLEKMYKTFMKKDFYGVRRWFCIRKTEIVPVSDEYIYDIFVQDNNNFFLNGILTHNSGKSSSMISICSFIQGCYRKLFTIDYICANSVEFLEKIKVMPESKLNNSIFLIDEEKNFFGYGSVAKKMKLQDVQNIVAKMNISTIQINPIKFVNPDAFYGLRCFGRDFNQKVCRFMLYNLQESGKGGTLPMGCVYVPIFNTFLPDFYAKKLNSDYSKKKDEWIRAEVRGENDALAEIRRNTAMSFLRDKDFLSIDKKGEKMAYINYKLGSDGWTTKEIEDIFQLTKLLERGVIREEKEEE
jgi:intein/homing endonuclease